MGRIGDMGLYGILTNPLVGYEKLAQVMVQKGVSIIQLRMKDTPLDEVFEMACRLRGIIPKEVVFIVNDDPRIALESGADGVHLGQGDMSIEKARGILGPGQVIGLSTHNPAQTEAACAQNPDYIGVGPVFPTPTKKVPDPAIGTEGMKAMLDKATVPAVCLGGIDCDNVDTVLRAGARNICAVRCINHSKDPGVELETLKAAIRSFL